MANEAHLAEAEANPEFLYLDSNFYLDYLQGDRPNHEALKAVMDAWRAGAVEIATSALTLAEVLYVKIDPAAARAAIDRSREPDVIDLFRQYEPRRLRLIEVDRTIGEAAREVFWNKGVFPRDAIHVASALRVHVPTFFTNDKNLLGCQGN